MALASFRLLGLDYFPPAPPLSFSHLLFSLFFGFLTVSHSHFCPLFPFPSARCLTPTRPGSYILKQNRPHICEPVIHLDPPPVVRDIPAYHCATTTGSTPPPPRHLCITAAVFLSPSMNECSHALLLSTHFGFVRSRAGGGRRRRCLSLCPPFLFPIYTSDDKRRQARFINALLGTYVRGFTVIYFGSIALRNTSHQPRHADMHRLEPPPPHRSPPPCCPWRRQSPKGEGEGGEWREGYMIPHICRRGHPPALASVVLLSVSPSF